MKLSTLSETLFFLCRVLFDIGEDYPYINEAKTLKALGIIKGDGYGNFRPKEYITREEATLMVYRMLQILKN